MNFVNSAGAAFRVTATGTVCVTTANAAIIGVMFNGTGTGSVLIFAGPTSTGASALLGKIVAYPTVAGVTANQAVYYPFPAIASGGITLQTPGTTDAALTLFWNPTGG